MQESVQDRLPCAGVYNEAAWRGFDYILAQAALFDIRVSGPNQAERCRI